MPVVGANGIDIWYDTFGSSDDPTLLLVCGLGAQGVGFGESLCEGFVDRGFHVMRFDNRDSGLSTHVRPDEPYTIADMADDAVGLMDALGIASAHVVGSSMGGMIAQQIAIADPERVLSLTSIMSTTGEPHVGGAEPDVIAKLLTLAEPSDDGRDGAIGRSLELARLIAGPYLFDEDWHRRRQSSFYDRADDPGGVARQLGAVVGSPHRAEGLRRIRVPTLVIHGTVDPLVHVSGGRRTAELVDGARLVEIPEMGHDMAPSLWPRYVDDITEFIAASAA